MLDRPDDAERWAHLATGILKRMGPGHERLQAWLANNRGLSRMQAGDLEAAEADLREAIRLKQKVLGSDNPDVAWSVSSLAEVRAHRGDFADAIAVTDRALAILERAYGTSSPMSLYGLGNRCEYLNGLGRYGAALESCRASRSGFAPTVGENHVWFAYTLTAEGIALIGLGRAKDALPDLRRALDLRERIEPRLELHAETRFALARALWETGDRKAGRAAGEAARAVYAKVPKAERERRAVDAWLAAHVVRAARPRP